MPDVMDLIADTAAPYAFPAVELYRDTETCEVARLRYLATPETITCGSYNMTYRGVAYVRPEATFKGLCGALIMVASRYPIISAMHTMGRDNRGTAVRLIRSDILQGIETLRVTGVNRGPTVHQPTTAVYTPPGLEAKGEIGELAPNSVLREVLEGTQFLPLGTLRDYKQVRTKTRLDVSPLSPLVTAITGEERKHEPPRTIGKATVERTKLQEMADRHMLQPEHLFLAMRDTKDELVALVHSTDAHRFLKPLTMDEATSGMAGSSTVRAINRSTAAGFPYVGSKHPFVVDKAREGLPDAFVLTPEVEAEVVDALSALSRLERLNFVFKGSHKDEAVKLQKLKTRMFEGSPLVFTIITRMLFLPIVRLYLMAREETCSGVGIDATSYEWHELAQHMLKYNATEALVGDWRHMDTSQTYQEMMAIFTIWIEIAEEFGQYSPDLINAMWSVAEETCRHYVLMRGDIGITEGTTASGGPLTVYVNNEIVNNRMKCAFYALAMHQGDIPLDSVWRHARDTFTTGGLGIVRNGRAGLEPLLPTLHGRFADYVRSYHYGDDFMMAAKPVVLPWFNQMTLFDYFQENGLELTDTNKGPFSAPTTPWSDVSFLKRAFRLDEDVGMYMAPLEIASIYKSMHVWPVKLEWAPEVHAAQILNGAMRELLQHGRAAYEDRAPKLLEVARRFGSDTYMDQRDWSYEAMVEDWRHKQVTGLAMRTPSMSSCDTELDEEVLPE